MTDHRPVDVALMIDTLERGGAERVMIAIANGLDPDRFRVHVILTRRPGALVSALAPHVEVHVLWRRSRWQLGALPAFARLVDRAAIRIVHTHSHSAAYFARIARPLGHAAWRHVMHDHHGPVEGSMLLRGADRILLRGVDHYFAVSDRLAGYARRSIRVPAERVERLLNGIPVPDTAGGTRDEPFTIVQVARVVPDKNQSMAVDAALALRESLPDFRWLLVGRDTAAYARACAERIARAGLTEQVLMLGERADVGAMLARAHAGVLTSAHEGLPLAVLEYMAAGLPFVVTDVGDCADVIAAGARGVAVPAGDANAMASALAQIARDPSAARRDGEINQCIARERYGVEAMVSRVAAVYERLLAGG